MSEDAVRLPEEQARLFKFEMKEEISAYLSDGLILSLGGLVDAVGFALLSSRLPRGGGVVHMLLGGATVLAMMKRITKRSPVPRRIAEEVGEDRRWSREMI